MASMVQQFRKRGAQTILIVDDDEEWRQYLCDVLSPPYKVVSVANGDDAIASVRNARPDLVFLDVMIPGKDGFTVFCELRQSPSTSHIPVIFLSEVNPSTDSMFDAEMVKRYLGESPAAFLEKPIKKEAVLRAVQKVLGPSRD